MKKIFLLSVIVFSLSGCTGAMYKIPSVSDTELKALQDRVTKENNSFIVYERSDKYYQATLQEISKKLRKNATPLCEDSGYLSCYFQVNYNPDSTVNAYASEGYKITVYRGLLQYLKTKDEIAAVIGHEMGHHLAKHNEKQKENAQVGAAVSGVITAILLGTANANNPYYNSYQQQQDQKTIENMMGAGAKIGVLSYSKEQEREADLLAAYLLSRSGYDLNKAKNLMLVLARFSGETKDNSAAFLSSHPAGVERVVSWEKTIEEIKNNKKRVPYRVEKQN